MLILKVCSAVHMDCLPPIHDSFVFNSWSECASAGYLRSITIMNNMESSIINNNKVVINFKCTEVEESQENIMDKMIGIFLEEITKFWEKVKSYVKDKIKKIICTCKCREKN